MIKGLIKALAWLAAIAIVGIGTYFGMTVRDLPIAQDAEETSSLVSKLQKEVSQRGMRVEIYGKPSRSKNSLQIYGEIGSIDRQSIISIAKQIGDASASKSIVIRFYKAKLYDASEEIPTDTVVLPR